MCRIQVTDAIPVKYCCFHMITCVMLVNGALVWLFFDAEVKTHENEQLIHYSSNRCSCVTGDPKTGF